MAFEGSENVLVLEVFSERGHKQATNPFNPLLSA